ncbi:MAG: PEP/pyruvate-binding domain-containing protein [Chitinophagales bacterium]
MKNQLLTFLLFFLYFPLFTNAQAIYNGHVQDVANGNAISGVTVELLNTAIEQRSNYFGDFLVKNTEIDSLNQPQNSYRFYNNSMIWEGEMDISLRIFSVNGNLVDAQNQLGNSGSYLFPNFPFGVNILQVETQNGVQSFRAFSDGQKTVIADKEAIWHRSSVPSKADTLLFSKEGYYSRAIPLQGSDTLLTINLLKKINDNEEIHYFNELLAPVAFELMSNLPSRSNDGGVSSVKIIYNTDNNLMYYMNTKLYKYHSEFAQKQLDFKQGNNVFNQTQYQENENRFLYPANLNYYKDLDIYVIYLITANEMPCEKIKILYDKILATSYMKGKLFLYENRPEFRTCDIPRITSEELYKGQNYQALNLTENYGYLNKVELQDLEDTYLGRHDIVLLNGVPNDVSVVAGIITTEFQTPLSHINVLSHNRNTPNMALRDGWDNELLDSFLGELVYLKVRSDSFELRKATLEEATDFWDLNEPNEVIELEKNTEVDGLVDLYSADYRDLDIIGGKASNFAEMLNVWVNDKQIPVPESPFAIPFHYYDQHLKSAGLDVFIEEMLQDEDFINSPATRRARLEDLQDRIKDHLLDAELVDLVRAEIKNFEEFPSFRFRSSTNAEDLEDFSGAGLYSSYSAKKDNSKKTIDRAIKKVWASLWNWRAFEERSYYKIVHTSCAMGILVHRSFPDEDANGVLITKNLYNNNPGFIINVQYKEHSIVFPEPNILNDQIMLLTWSIVPDQNFMIEYLTFSNIPELNGETVMTDAELMELGEYCLELKRHFYRNVPHNCNCSEQEFGLDIEFKVDSQVSNRKIYVKQARFYK